MNMNDPIASLLGSWATELNLYSVLLRVAVSVVFAAMIGCERASKRHAAGQRTFILVSLASTMAMLLDQSVERAGGSLVSAAAVIAIAIARYVFPVPAGPMPNTIILSRISFT